MNGVPVDLGNGLGVLVAPLLRSDGVTRSLPDSGARVRLARTQLEARWPDGVRLRLRIGRAGRRRRLTASVVAGPEVLRVDALGVRLSLVGAPRILVDGYHSWDWAGVRDTRLPGHGWWGAVWGSPRTRALVSVALHDHPRVGALALQWDGVGSLDAVSCGEPFHAGDGTGPPRPLGAELHPGETFAADPLGLGAASIDDTAGAGLPPRRAPDRRPGPRQVGWMSWNCLGPDVSAADVVEAAETLVPPGGVALLDDGWMPFWGDWIERPDFDSSLADLAAAVRESGRRLGLWLAPFLVDPRAGLATDRPDLLLRDPTGRPVVDERPPAPQWVLDTSRQPVRAHLAELGARLADQGVSVLKLDFLYAGALLGDREPGWSGIQALRAGIEVLAGAFRAAAGSDAAVWACGAPGPGVAGLVDACRSGGDAVLNVPAANAPQPPRPWFVHGEAITRAQARNLAARSWLWGSTLPCDVDAVTLGPIGYLAALDEPAAAAWLELARRSGGPLLVADEPSATGIAEEALRRLRRLQAEVAGSPPIPARPLDPLDAPPAPMGDDSFYAWPEGISQRWTR